MSDGRSSLCAVVSQNQHFQDRQTEEWNVNSEGERQSLRCSHEKALTVPRSFRLKLGEKSEWEADVWFTAAGGSTLNPVALNTKMQELLVFTKKKGKTIYTTMDTKHAWQTADWAGFYTWLQLFQHYTTYSKPLPPWTKSILYQSHKYVIQENLNKWLHVHWWLSSTSPKKLKVQIFFTTLECWNNFKSIF